VTVGLRILCVLAVAAAIILWLLLLGHFLGAR
jgi:hypothetical protein